MVLTNFTKDADWLTRLVDKLLLIQTKEPSKVNLTTEVAVIQPGHSKYINNLAMKAVRLISMTSKGVHPALT
jgi:cell surface protein SprA